MKTLHNTLEDMFQTATHFAEYPDHDEHLGSLQDIDEVIKAINSDTVKAEEVAADYIFKIAKEVNNVTLGYMDWVLNELLDEGAKFCDEETADLLMDKFGAYYA